MHDAIETGRTVSLHEQRDTRRRHTERRSYTRPTRRVFSVFAVVLALTSIACGAPPVRETTPLAAKPSSFTSGVVSVAPGAHGGAKNVEKYMKTFREALAKKLVRDKTIAAVASTGDEGDLAIRATVRSIDAGSVAARDLGVGGNAEVSLDVELLDRRTGKAVGRFTVTGNTKDYEQSFADILLDTPLDDDADRAFLVAAEHSAAYLAGDK